MSLGDVVVVALAGGVGAGVRWAIDQAFRSPRGFPWAILFVNVTGCFAMTLLLGLFGGAHTLPTILAVGFLGGYTTFSTVNADTVDLWRAGRRRGAVGNALGTLLLCALGAGAGVWAASGVRAVLALL